VSDAPQRKPVEEDDLEIPAFLDRRKKKTTAVLTDDQQFTTSRDSKQQEPEQ
jgi:hypothetical protein